MTVSKPEMPSQVARNSSEASAAVNVALDLTTAAAVSTLPVAHESVFDRPRDNTDFVERRSLHSSEHPATPINQPVAEGHMSKVSSKVDQERLNENIRKPSRSLLTPLVNTAPEVASVGPTPKHDIESEIHADPETAKAPMVVTAAAGDSPAMAAGTAENAVLDELQKFAAEAAKQAGQDYMEAGKQAQLTLKDLLSLREKEGPPVTLTVDQIATAAIFLVAGLQLLILPIFLPSTFRLLYSLLWGLLVGLGLSFLFFHNKKKKAEVNELLSTNLGLKGIQLVAAGVPALCSVSNTEKMEWLNALVVEVWPFVDKAVCNMVKDITAQMMPGILQSLPPVLSSQVKSVGFKHLTFGAVPFRVEGIHVHKEADDGLVLELSVKWCGDPNITLAIEVPAGQKLCPRMLDITFAVTVRVLLRPLVPRLPGFVALMATVPKPPLIKYRLDFGKALGGSMLPKLVTPVIDYFIKGTLDRMLVWPNRIVLPILQSTPPCAAVSPKEWEDADRKLERLANTEIVTWEHFTYLLVLEPESQVLRLEAFDVADGRGRDGRRRIGRALVKLNPVCKEAMQGSKEHVSVRAQLGENDWGSPGGPGKGAGTVLLHMWYFPCEDFTQEQVLGARKGILTVRLLAIGGLTPGVNNNVTAYASFNLTSQKKAGHPSWKTAKRTWTLAGHVAGLKGQMRRLELARERDLREGDTAAAEAKAVQMRALQEEIDTAAEKNKTRSVTLDYSMETQAFCSFYGVKERLEDESSDDEAGEGGDGESKSLQDCGENTVHIKVVQEGRVKRTAETIGVVEVPVSRIKNSYCLNPLSGKKEYGLYIQKCQNFDPESPGVAPPESEWGLPLSGSATGRVWLVARWVPCVEAAPQDLTEEDRSAFVNVLKPGAAAGQAK
ncbi:hypothetical protein VOLCADRAFT_107980 [Volvox carteri f. nagariensis]|uniref:SMP-LTD domain-containing protein n=1 Tax=Volvox carteri f. nagariensis TaxID=3068 RepID=D8UHK2_VOLCA|nr:uncharacterized protein VOLCADRAFT_107980 [Volvox carteri f. nagariensis]EFJ40788.1 hypothetical protein VOLCADRAFT_107980 [Volvox carteri f. nagariensis]|eukprot:XP_002958163.1 hypothetical protein VOLCADRAFT_107980 [Volvox carteri f. nagariensis]